MHVAVSSHLELLIMLSNICILTAFGSFNYFHGKHSQEWYMLPDCPPKNLFWGMFKSIFMTYGIPWKHICQ